MLKSYPVKYLLLILFTGLFCLSFGQTSRLLFSAKNYGGSNGDDPVRIIATPDGGRIMCGTTNSNDHDVSGLHGTENDIWVTKINAAGAIEWQKTYETNASEAAQYMIATSDGGYAVVGVTNFFSGSADGLVIKITSTGTVQWKKQFGGGSADRAWQIAETTDGGFVVTGETIGTPSLDFAGLVNHGGYDLFVSKLSGTGTLLWSKIYGGSQDERGIFIRQLTDGNLLLGARAVSNDGDVTGNHNNYDAGDYWILKLSPAGNIIWKKCYGSIGDETPYNMIEKNNRYYIIGTTMNLSHADNGDVTGVIDAYDMWLVTLDTAGTLVRQKCIGGTSSVDEGFDIAWTLDNNIIIAGDTQSDDVYVSGNHGLTDLAMIKVDTLGNLMWSKLFGTTDYDRGKSISVNADSSYSLLGYIQQTGGDVTTYYGGGDYWLVNYADTSLYPDLYVKLSGPAAVYARKQVRYQLRFGRRTRPVATDTVTLYLVKNTHLQLLTSSRPVTATSGDTLFWKLPKVVIMNADSIALNFMPDSTSPMVPDSMRLKAYIGPYGTEFFQGDNTASLAVRASYQNAAIGNVLLDITSVPAVSTGRTVSYDIPVSFQSNLDTTFFSLRVIKDPRTNYVSSTPANVVQSGDTLTWQLRANGNFFGPFALSLQVKDTPFVQLNDVLKTRAILRFNTLDTTVLQYTDSVLQTVTAICTAPSTVNTTLPPPQGIQWLRTFGGSDYDYGYTITRSSDSAFFIAGDTYSDDGDLAGEPGGSNIFVAKYLTDGRLVWKKSIGGGAEDYHYSAAPVNDGGLIITAETYSSDGPFAGNHGNGDILLARLDSAGSIVWQKVLGGTRNESSPVIRQTAGNHYIIMTSTSSRNGDVANPYTDTLKNYPWLFEINENGNILWQKVLSDSIFTYWNDIQPTLDSGYVIGGELGVFDPNTFVTTVRGRLIKTDKSGNVLFMKTYRNTEHDTHIASVVVNADSSFTFTGHFHPNNIMPDAGCLGDHGLDDVWVGKTDKLGNLLWQRFYGGENNDQGYAIIRTAGGGYMIAGSTMSDNGNATDLHNAGTPNSDAWLIQLDADGKLVWQKTIGGDGYEEAIGLMQLPNNDVLVTGYSNTQNSGDIYGSKGNDDAIILKIGAANYIRGYVYLDNNGNHIHDAGEPFFTEGIVKSSKPGNTRSSDIVDGYYANSADTGHYVTAPVINAPYYTVFPASGTTDFTGYLQADTINFGLVPIGGINDLELTLLPVTAARPGFPAIYSMRYTNAGTTTITNARITLVKDQRTTADSASVPFTSVTGDTLRWDIGTLAPTQYGAILVYLKPGTPPAVNNGDTLHFTATVDPAAGDSTPVNNTVVLNQLVTGSYDPNDKTETHGPGFPAQLLANGEYLNYVIRFQNTGTDTAFRVIVRDTLDNNLDWNSLQMLSASHPYHLTISNGNGLEWKFDPILLPDSTNNEPLSHGYIAYRIKPLRNLAEGDTIRNRAAIYFDFNLPVLTNQQQTVIDNGVSICPGNNTTYKAGVTGGLSFRWQVNTGSGYTDISNGGVYTGATTGNLQLAAPPTSFAGYKYRCVVTTAGGTVYSAEYTLKFGVSWTGAVSTDWGTAGNWSCGIIPDANTDVTIKSGATVVVNSNATIRTLTLKTGVQFFVASNINFTIRR